MGRSYLFAPRDTRTLTPTEYELERLYDQIDTPTNRITPDIFFKSPQYGQFLDRKYGSLSSMIPPGSQIINQTPLKLEYKDAEGYTHVITRQGADASGGTISRQTDKPPIPPNKGQNDILAQLQARLQQNLGPLGLAELPPEVSQQLQAMSDAEKARIAQQGEDTRGQLVAQLYGNRVNQSSIANDAAARFAQALGLVQQQQSSDAAARNLGLRQYLTSAGLQQNQDLASLLASLSGQQNQRDIAGAGLDLDKLRLDESSRQFNASNYLDQLRTQLAQQELNSRGGVLNKIGQIVGLVRSGSQAVGGGLSAYDALRRRF